MSWKKFKSLKHQHKQTTKHEHGKLSFIILYFTLFFNTKLILIQLKLPGLNSQVSLHFFLFFLFFTDLRWKNGYIWEAY